MTTFSAGELIELQKQLREAAKTLARVADQIGVYIPSVAPDEPSGELVILISDYDSGQFVAALSRCAGAVDAMRKALDQDGGGRAT